MIFEVTSTGDFETLRLLQQRIYKNPAQLKLNNPDVQILIAVHYLTQIDQQKRNYK